MVVVEFDEIGLIKKYIYDVENVELDKHTILFSDNNYNMMLEWYKMEEIQYLFNANEFKIIDDNVGINDFFITYIREFVPPFETNREKIKKLEEENAFLKRELDNVSMHVIDNSIDMDYRLSLIEISMAI